MNGILPDPGGVAVHGSTARIALHLLYTGFSRCTAPTPMPLALSRRITHRTILAVLIAGFGLVILLLLAAAAVAVHNTRAIQSDAADLVREQTLTARLMSQTRAEQAALNAVFNQLTHDPESVDRDELLRQLDATGESLARVVRNAEHTPQAQRWQQLERSVRAFAAEARRVTTLDRLSDTSLRSLFKLHDEVVQVVRGLADASSERARTAEAKIASDAQQWMSQSVLLLGGSCLLALVCAVLTMGLTSALFRRMENQASELSRVSWHMLKGQEEAARRFSHELHDELGQSLTALKSMLSGITRDTVQERRSECVQVVNDAITNVRELSQLLRPVILDDFGLEASLRWLSEKFSQRTGISVSCDCRFKGRLQEETETHLFRISQEALTNVARHSGATSVAIQLRPRDTEVVLTISDNGKGLRASGPQERGIGMVGMRARAQQAGGDFQVRAAPGGGVELEVRVPLEPADTHAHEESQNPVGR